MLVGEDRLELPEDVILHGDTLTDPVRGASWPVNACGAYVLGRAGETIDAIACGLAEAFGVPRERAAADTASFAARLNRLLLLNVRARRRTRRRVALALRLAPLRILPAAQARRVALNRRWPARLLLALVPRALWLGLAVAALPSAMGVLAPVQAAALGVAAAAGFVLHEAAHVLALGHRRAALVLHGRRVFVLHAPLPGVRRVIVALSGPLVPAAAGVLLVAAASAAAAPTAALAGMLLTTHVLGATVAARDGRTACGL